MTMNKNIIIQCFYVGILKDLSKINQSHVVNSLTKEHLGTQGIQFLSIKIYSGYSEVNKWEQKTNIFKVFALT